MTLPSAESQPALVKALGTRDVFVAGVALVVASTTLVSDFVGYFTLGLSFAMAIIIAFVINLFLGLSASELAVWSPRAGAIYDYGRDVVGGTAGKLVGLFLGLTFAGMFVLVGPSEASAGGFGLQALFDATSGLNWFILIMAVIALHPEPAGDPDRRLGQHRAPHRDALHPLDLRDRRLPRHRRRGELVQRQPQHGWAGRAGTGSVPPGCSPAAWSSPSGRSSASSSCAR